jgi:hypothetical protein
MAIAGDMKTKEGFGRKSPKVSLMITAYASLIDWIHRCHCRRGYQATKSKDVVQHI